jgi:hypothetical protein
MIIGPIYTIVSSLTVIIGPLLMKYTPPWVPIILGSVMVIGGAVISSFTKSFYVFMIFYGVIFAAGIGIVYLVPLMCSWSYFPKRKGMVSGIIFSGYGFGGFIFGFISLATANPNNLEATLKVEGGSIFAPDSAAASSMPFMLRINAIIWT